MLRHPLLVTLFVILTAATILIVFDVWLYGKGGAGATISWQTYQAARREPIIPIVIAFVVGVLFGHLFWPQYGQ